MNSKKILSVTKKTIFKNPVMNTLKRKNLESFFVDLLIIFGSFFFSKIEVSSVIFSILVLITIAILFISKRPPKNYFLVILYVICVFFIFFGIIFIAENLFIDINENFKFNDLDTVSWLVLTFALIVLFSFVFTYSKKGKRYDFVMTFLVPVLLTLFVYTTTYISSIYSAGVGILILIYLPLRFLMAYQEPVKWYQFILLIAALIFALNSFINADKNNPISTVNNEMDGIYAKYICTEFEDFKNDQVVKVVLKKRSYATKVEEGEYFFVTEYRNDIWKVNYDKTVAYYKEKNIYYSYSSKLHFLILYMTD